MASYARARMSTPALYDASGSDLSQLDLLEIQTLHSSDTNINCEKDSIELTLARLCLDKNIPFLGICWGSLVLNVASGSTLYLDVEKELSRRGNNDLVAHIDYNNYDGHQHEVELVENTPLYDWFKEEFRVNSYHHQGVKRLGQRFVPMAFASDRLVGGFYDPEIYNPDKGKFIMGLQFHPERMRRNDSAEFDYPGCASAYQAVIAYRKKVDTSLNPKVSPKMDQEIEKRRKIIVRSFCIAKDIYVSKLDKLSLEESDLEAGAEFLQSCTVLRLQQEKRLKQMGATVRNASSYMERMRKNEERGASARNVMEKMSMEQLSDLFLSYDGANLFRCIGQKTCRLFGYMTTRRMTTTMKTDSSFYNVPSNSA